MKNLHRFDLNLDLRSKTPFIDALTLTFQTFVVRINKQKDRLRWAFIIYPRTYLNSISFKGYMYKDEEGFIRFYKKGKTHIPDFITSCAESNLPLNTPIPGELILNTDY